MVINAGLWSRTQQPKKKRFKYSCAVVLTFTGSFTVLQNFEIFPE